VVEFGLPREALSLLRLLLAFAGTVVAALCGAVAVLLPPLGAVFAVAAAVAYEFVWFRYLPRYVRTYRVCLEKNVLSVCRGVFIRTEHLFPRPRLIYAVLLQLPVARRMGVCCIQLRAAQGHLLLPFVRRADAVKLLNRLDGAAA